MQDDMCDMLKPLHKISLLLDTRLQIVVHSCTCASSTGCAFTKREKFMIEKSECSCIAYAFVYLFAEDRKVSQAVLRNQQC